MVTGTTVKEKDMGDHGDMPIEDFTHVLLKSVIYIRWTLIAIFIIQVAEYIR